MSGTQTVTRTAPGASAQAAPLQIGIQALGLDARFGWGPGGDPSLADASELLETVLEFVGVTQWASETPQRPRGTDWTEWVATLERETSSTVFVRHLQLGSPFDIALTLPAAIATATPAVTALIYAAKRLWGFDLELRTHREEMRAKYLEAKRRADDAARVGGLANAGVTNAPYADAQIERMVSEQRRPWNPIYGELVDLDPDQL